MPSRRLIVLPLVVTLLVAGCAPSTAISDDPSDAPSTSPSASSTPTPTPSPSAAAGPEPTAATGSPIALTPLAPSADVTSEDLQASLPTAADLPDGWVQGFNDYAAIPYTPTFEPCGPHYWYVLGSPLESDVPNAEVRWASSGPVSEPPFPAQLGTLVRATPDAGAAFDRIAADLATCPIAGTSQSDMVATLRPAPAAVPDAACGDLLPTSGSDPLGRRTTFCVAAAGERIVVVSYDQFAPSQIAPTDAEIDALLGAAIARVLG